MAQLLFSRSGLLTKFRTRAVVALAVGVFSVAVIAYYYSHAGGVVAPADEVHDVAYGSLDQQKLDLYLPERTGTPIPVVIKIHGGAFLEGNKGDDVGYMKDAVLSKGWAVASVDYRLSGDAVFPAGVQDVRLAARWLRDNADKYGFDPNRFISWGESAGGYFAEMLGVTNDLSSDTLDGPVPRPLSQYPSGVQVAVSLYGPNDFSTMTAQGRDSCGGNADEHDSASSPEGKWLGGPVQSSPKLYDSVLEHYVNSNHKVAPLYMTHGTADCTVAIGQSEEMKAAYDKIGVTAELKAFSGEGHATSTINDGTVDGAIAFIEAHLPAASTPAPSATPEPTTAPTPVPTVSGGNPTPAPTTAPTASPRPGGTTPFPTAVPTVAPSVAPAVDGDLNHDNKVDLNDLQLLFISWNTSSTTNDMNSDGAVDVYDLSILLSHWQN